MVYQRRWYAVTVGKEVGVFSTWIEAAPKTKDVPGGAIHQSFSTREEAVHAFEAALARGEVKAYPDEAKKKIKSTSKPKHRDALLSPLGVETSLLRTPVDVKEASEAVGLHTLLSPRTRVSKLKRALRDSDSSETDSSSSSMSSSPPTGVTRVNPLFEEDDSPGPVARLSPHFTFTSSSSRAYPDISNGHLFKVDATKQVPVKLEVSDWSSPPATPSHSDTHPGAEEHTSKPPRCMLLHPDTPSRCKGVEYRSMADLADTNNIDARIWLPKPPTSRIFDPDKIKTLPRTRPPSPVKRDESSLPTREDIDGSPQPQKPPSLVDSPFISVGRGRRSRLTPSSSLPVLPDRECEERGAECESSLSQLPEKRRKNNEKERKLEYSASDDHLPKMPGEYVFSPRIAGNSHVQLIQRDGGDEQSVVRVRCPPNCVHEDCLRPPASPRYVDASVSPIIVVSGCVHRVDSPPKSRFKQPDLNEDDCLFELAGFTHVSHQGIPPEVDVRSPISKGTMIPINAAE